jgi:hypothetical protein
LQKLGWADDGYGILSTPDYDEGGAWSTIVANTCIGNEDVDILALATDTGDSNNCRDTSIYDDINSYAGAAGHGGCRYLAGMRLNCKADINHDCWVNSSDRSQMNTDYYWQTYKNNPDYCCPKDFENLHP